METLNINNKVFFSNMIRKSIAYPLIGLFILNGEILHFPFLINKILSLSVMFLLSLQFIMEKNIAFKVIKINSIIFVIINISFLVTLIFYYLEINNLIYEIYLYYLIAIVILFVINKYKEIKCYISLINAVILLGSIYYILYYSFDIIWYFIKNSSLWVSSIVCFIENQYIANGQTFTGINITILFIFVLLYIILKTKNITKLFRITIFSLSILWLVVYNLIQTYLYLFLNNFTFYQFYSRNNSETLNLNIILVFGYYIILLLLLKKSSYKIYIRVRYPTQIISIVLTTILVIFVTTNKNEAIGKKIYLVNKGIGNYEDTIRNETSRELPSFGLLKRYLEMFDNRVKIGGYDFYEIEQSNVIIMVNINENLTDDIKNSIYDFISKGNVLILLGDHTNIGGTMDFTNNFLDKTNIKYNFDCADELGNLEWENAYEFRNILKNTSFTSNDVGISIGASLNINYPASPMIIAKYGFSDIGNINEKGYGYMGNRKYDINGYYGTKEQKGDIVICACQNFGKGKIIVFGDTSPFQNLSLINTIKFINYIIINK